MTTSIQHIQEINSKMNDSNPDAQQAAAVELIEIGTDAVPDLIKALAHPNAHTR